jgi:hypothetical protein
MKGSTIMRAVVLGSVLASATLTVGHGTAVRAARVAVISRCTNVQLLIRPTSIGTGAAGHLARLYRAGLLFGGSCSLQGYPGVELLDRNFHTLPTHLKRGNGDILHGPFATPRVVVGRRHPAYFALEYSDVPVGNLPCVAAPYLTITPPNDFLPVVTFSGGILPCAGNIVVSPVESTAKLPTR